MEKDKNKSIWKQFPTWVLIASLISVVIIFFLPMLFTQYNWLGFDFEKTGEIGDTIGGIMTPFIAIVASGLTFAAFYMQYRANEIQIANFKEQKKQFKEQLDKQNEQFEEEYTQQTLQFNTQIKEQKEASEIEQFENKFFEMLRLHKENVNEIQKTNKDGVVKQGRQLFNIMFREFEFCYKVVSQLCEKQPELKDKKTNLIRISYAFYYTGIGKDAEPIFKAIIGDNPLTNEVHKYLKRLQENFGKKNKAGVALEGSSIRMPNNKIEIFYTEFKPLHGQVIGHYYRHLFQTVKFVDAQSFLKDDEKKKYTKIIRAQLTDYEQAMLYYNIVSGFGRKWVKDDKHKGVTLELLVKYKMIHNAIPNLLSIGKESYSEERDFFREQLRQWKKKNPDKKFFEWYENTDYNNSEEEELFKEEN